MRVRPHHRRRALPVMVSVWWARHAWRHKTGLRLDQFAQPGPSHVKAVKSALVVMPPVQVWDTIQEIRRQNDKSFYRWMPHINILYPFYEDVDNVFEDAAAQAEDALRDVTPFDVCLTQASFFEHGCKSSTVWLDPAADQESSANFAALHSALLRKFPDCTDLSHDPERDISGFVPHLSLGSWRGQEDAQRGIEAIMERWAPLEFAVNRVHLISRKAYDDPFRVRWEIPLGNASCIRREKNHRYLAAPVSSPDGDKSRDSWKQRKRRPAARSFKKFDMGCLPWGIFPHDDAV